jgi:hypothetical protein
MDQTGDAGGVDDTCQRRIDLENKFENVSSLLSRTIFAA